jgi:hypothetical protein
MAAAVSACRPSAACSELALDATVGVVVYAAVALTINAAGVRDVALRLMARRRARKGRRMKTPAERAQGQDHRQRRPQGRASGGLGPDPLPARRSVRTAAAAR